MKPNAINYLSLARKAGRIEVGEEPVGACARAGHARLVMVAGDAPENTVRRARNFVAGTEQQMVVLPFTKDEMGAALGRSSVALAAMTDPSMALAFLKAMEAPAYAKAIADLENRDQRARQHRQEEKAHERNLRTGKKRTEPETPKEQTPEEKRHFAKQRIAAREEKAPQEEKRPYRGKPEGDKRPYHGKPQGDKGPFRNPEGDRKPRAGKPEGEKRSHFGKPQGGPAKFGKAPEGSKPAYSLRKSGPQGPRQSRPAANGAAGRKFGRKTHGGAE